MQNQIIDLVYLLAAVLFILGLKRLTSPATARAGNQLAAVGMLIAVVATLFTGSILTPVELLLGLVVGGLIGAVLARKIAMTGMPELVAAFNGFGGLASALVAGAEVAKLMGESAAPGEALAVDTGVTIALSILIGTVTFSGSFVAFGKLSGKISGNPIKFPGIRVLSILMAAGVVVGTVTLAMGAGDFPTVSDPVVMSALGIAALSFLLGIILVIPIGGADMPVVVSLLNSYSGMAAAATGFVLNNNALIISGALVGAAGLILTMIMCEAMNRSLLNVLLGGFGGDAPPPVAGAAAAATAGKNVHSTSPEDAAILLSYAQKVIFVPGYGMAVAQAQHTVRELAELLQEKGVEVKYAIHPVAGRMPGHMNVLLAEANVPYDLLFEMDDVNGDFDSTDVAVVIGANDVVNPAARHDTASPIYGMPILNVDHAQTVIVMKRSLNPGYAGIDNELFYQDNTRMLFGDAKASLTKLVTEVKDL